MEVPPLKKMPKNEQTNNKILEFNEKLRRCISQKKTLKKSKNFLSATCWVKWQITTLSFTIINNNNNNKINNNKGSAGNTVH